MRAVLERLAFAAHRNQESATDTADISESELVKALLDINPDNKEIRPRQLMDYLEHRTGVLAPRAPGVYTFPHRSFQEYLAARHLNREDLDLGDFDDEAALIADLGRRDPDRWREVVLLAAANGPRLAWDVADLLLPELPAEGPLPIQDAWGARLGGQILLESTDYTKASPRRARIRDRIRDGQLAVMRRSTLPAPERAAAGDCLAALGDPRFDPRRCYLPAEPLLGFVGIPASSFTMGSDEARDADAWDDEQPQHRLTLPMYWIGRWPVTVAQFRDFVRSSGYHDHRESALSGQASRPVVNVSWHDAQAYCDWLDSRLRELVSVNPTWTSESAEVDELHASIRSGALRVRLPSEAEWEKAARGSDARRYPWGEPPDTERANVEMAIGETSVVGGYPDGASPFGCEEMSGNVLEWTRSAFGEYPYPESGRSLQEREQAVGAAPRVLRGGAFVNLPRGVRCAYRDSGAPDLRGVSIGFRVVLSPFPLDSGPDPLISDTLNRARRIVGWGEVRTPASPFGAEEPTREGGRRPCWGSLSFTPAYVTRSGWVSAAAHSALGLCRGPGSGALHADGLHRRPLERAQCRPPAGSAPGAHVGAGTGALPARWSGRGPGCRAAQSRGRGGQGLLHRPARTREPLRPHQPHRRLCGGTALRAPRGWASARWWTSKTRRSRPSSPAGPRRSSARPVAMASRRSTPPPPSARVCCAPSITIPVPAGSPPTRCSSPSSR